MVKSVTVVMQNPESHSPQPTAHSACHGALDVLNTEVTACTRCPRLVAFREKIGREKRRAYMDWEYWARPVPGFGDLNARVLVLGLAPGAHGSNRTGRPFTGDSSGNFMYPVLHRTGFANQPTAKHRDDGLTLTDAYITAAVRCAPPQNKPTPAEIANCAPFLDRELECLANIRVVVALGRIGFDAYLNHLKRRGVLKNKAQYIFGHGLKYDMPDGRILLASYHPSNQNTNTGKLTEDMFTEIFREARRLVKRADLRDAKIAKGDIVRNANPTNGNATNAKATSAKVTSAKVGSTSSNLVIPRSEATRNPYRNDTVGGARVPRSTRNDKGVGMAGTAKSHKV